MSDLLDPEFVERALVRERRSRRLAERLLEDKARELYALNRSLRERNEALAAEEQAMRDQYEELRALHEELRDTRQQLIQQEKLASIGQLAAGVAHEINNPVAFISSNLSSMAHYTRSLRTQLAAYRDLYDAAVGGEAVPSEVLEAVARAQSEEDVELVLTEIDAIVQESLEGTARVKDIVLGLKTFARPDGIETAPLALDECIQSVLKMLWNKLKYTCEVTTDFRCARPVMGNAGELSQVFMNLLCNASDAVSSGGQIRVETCEDGPWCEVRVIDDGCGIDDSAMSSLFTPFFTTKDVGEGTGLGLSISHGIVERHGGSISVTSTPGSGSTFLVRLPAVPGSTEAPTTR